MKIGSGQSKTFVPVQAWCRALLFLVFGVIFGLVVQTILVYGLRRQSAGNIGTLNLVMEGAIDADILISGSSRAMYHYDPRVIETGTGRSAFNIGRDGTKLHEQLHLLRLYLQRNRAPAYVIQNVDITTLVANNDITDPKQYIPWLRENDVYQPLVALRRYYIVYRALPLVAIARTAAAEPAVMGIVHPTRTSVNQYKGYIAQDHSWNEDFSKFMSRNPAGVTLSIDGRRVDMLNALVDLARERGIRLILVYSPEYTEAQAAFLNRAEVMGAIRGFSERARIPFWDYSDDLLSKERRNFYNSQHLNHAGATAFSRALTERLVSEVSGRRPAGETTQARNGAATLRSQTVSTTPPRPRQRE